MEPMQQLKRETMDEEPMVRNPVMPVLTNKKNIRGDPISQICTDYVHLAEVCDQLICVTHSSVLNEAPEVLTTRMRLMREKHGPHPVNPAFARWLSLSLVYLRFKVSLHLMQEYVSRELHPQTADDEPDMLLRTMDSLKQPFSEYANPFLLSAVVEELHRRHQLNRWLIYENSCVLNAYIQHMDPDYIALKDMSAGQWNAAFERYFSSLVSNPDVDVDLTEAAARNPELKITRPLEVALRGGQYRAAISLLSRRANVHLIDVTGVKFMTGASLAFFWLTVCGFAFPAIEDLKKLILVEDEEKDHWSTFLKWLEQHRQATSSLTALCLAQIPDDPTEKIRRFFSDYEWPDLFRSVMHCKRKNQIGSLYERGTRKILKRPRISDAG